MTEDEISAIVADSNADYETDDTSEMVASLQAVTAESLPEDWRLYELRDETGGDGIRHIDAVATKTLDAKVYALARALLQHDFDKAYAVLDTLWPR